MLIKVKDGTKLSAPTSLCASCSNVTHIKGASLSEEIQFCSAVYPASQISFPVVSCTDFSRRGDTKLKDMEKVAWIVNIKGGRAVGFVTPDQFKEEHPDERPSCV